MAQWTRCPHAGAYRFDSASLAPHWGRLHQGDAEPLPDDPALLDAWVHFHNGEFEQAAQAGLRLGDAGWTLANKATCIYAHYIEPREQTRLDLLLGAADRAEAQQKAAPRNPNAWYWQAYAVGRYSQGISVAKALARGLGGKVRRALETAIALNPRHADAHLALANFHAEVIDKVGELIGGMTYGARKDTGLSMYQTALALNPGSAITLAEYANGLLMLAGDRASEEATRLMARAAAIEPLDAMEHLYADSARMALEN